VHGEHELLLHAPLPASATVITRARMVSVTPKRSGSVIVLVAETEDAATKTKVGGFFCFTVLFLRLISSSGVQLCTNILRVFVRGVTLPEIKDSAAGAATVPPMAIPLRKADATVDIATSRAFYTLAPQHGTDTENETRLTDSHSVASAAVPTEW
jgi:hypothetical protein